MRPCFFVQTPEAESANPLANGNKKALETTVIRIERLTCYE